MQALGSDYKTGVTPGIVFVQHPSLPVQYSKAESITTILTMYYSPGTFGLLFLFIAGSQKLGGEAGPCQVSYRSHKQTWVISGTEYKCTVSGVPYCRGGCAATMKYDLHVSDANSPKSRCSVEVNQCVATGTDYLELTTHSCKLKSDGSDAPEANGNLVPMLGANACNCVIYYSSATADECENEFIVD